MSRRPTLRKVSIAGFLCALVLVGILLTKRSAERVNGKSLPQWVEELVVASQGTSGHWHLEAATPTSKLAETFRETGTNSLAYLVNRIEHPQIKKTLIPHTLLTKLPPSLRERLVKPTPPIKLRHSQTLGAFWILQEQALVATNQLIPLLGQAGTRARAMDAMAVMGPKIVPALLQLLASTDPSIQVLAARAMQLHSPHADATVERLLDELQFPWDPASSRRFCLNAPSIVDEHILLSKLSEPYPQLVIAVRQSNPVELDQAVANAIDHYREAAIQVAQLHHETLECQALFNASSKLLGGTPDSKTSKEFFRRVDTAIAQKNSRHFALHLLKLETLIQQNAYTQAADVAQHALELAQDNWRMNHELASGLILSVSRNGRLRSVGRTAAERADRLTQYSNSIVLGTRIQLLANTGSPEDARTVQRIVTRRMRAASQPAAPAPSRP